MTENLAAAEAEAAGEGVGMYEACLCTVSLGVSMEEALLTKSSEVAVGIGLGHPQFDHLHPQSMWVKDEHIYPTGVG